MSVESGCDWTSLGSCANAQWDSDEPKWTLVTFDTGIGAMQLTGATATSVAYSMNIEPDTGEDSLSANFNNNIRGGVKYLSEIFVEKTRGKQDPGLISNWNCALGAYNGGPGLYCNNPKYITDIGRRKVPFYYDSLEKWYIEDDLSQNNRLSYVKLDDLWKTTCGIQEVNSKNLWVCKKV